MRIARHVSAYSGSFPRVSDDPLVQFLVEEAVMHRYEQEVVAARAEAAAQSDAEASLELARAEARAESARRLSDYLETRGG
jgi:hypothetical protein